MSLESAYSPMPAQCLTPLKAALTNGAMNAKLIELVPQKLQIFTGSCLSAVVPVITLAFFSAQLPVVEYGARSGFIGALRVRKCLLLSSFPLFASFS